MNNLLEQISKPIGSDLKDFENEFYASLDSDVKIINTIVRYLVKNKGKRFRPILCLLSAKICGDINKETHIIASLLEILHVATLIHDDVVDDSDMRRGWPSVSRVWKNKLSILIGDYLFSKALTNMARTNSIEAVKILAHLASRLSQGEILQIEQVVNKTIDERSYFKMISDKTASLFSASCKLGAITSTSDQKKIKALSVFGEYLGQAFQIKDDLFDILGSIGDLGKPSGYDLKKNMLTLPLIHIINKKNIIEKKLFKIKIKLLSRNKNFKSIKSLIINEGGINYAEKKLLEISLLAEKELEVFDDSDIKSALIKSLKFNLERNS